jgi:hypothetical protein
MRVFGFGGDILGMGQCLSDEARKVLYGWGTLSRGNEMNQVRPFWESTIKCTVCFQDLGYAGLHQLRI